MLDTMHLVYLKPSAFSLKEMLLTIETGNKMKITVLELCFTHLPLPSSLVKLEPVAGC